MERFETCNMIGCSSLFAFVGHRLVNCQTKSPEIVDAGGVSAVRRSYVVERDDSARDALLFFRRSLSCAVNRSLLPFYGDLHCLNSIPRRFAKDSQRPRLCCVLRYRASVLDLHCSHSLMWKSRIS
ncbi:unnamed protein product [Camellia sinensis]